MRLLMYFDVMIVVSRPMAVDSDELLERALEPLVERMSICFDVLPSV